MVEGGTNIWQSRSAQRDAYAMSLDALNRNPHPYRPYTSCVLQQEARVVITQFGETSHGETLHDVLVLDGPDAGCRGVIDEDFLRVP